MKQLLFIPLLVILGLVLLAFGYLFAAIVVLLVALIPIFFKPWRRAYIVTPLWMAFREALPTMSTTEREALESGSVWWDGELFSGKPNWHQFLNSAKHELAEDEQAFLDGPTEELCRQLDDWQISQEYRDLPSETWDYLKQNGFFGLIIPTEYGGLGFSALAHSQMVMKVASRSVTAAVTVMVPNSLGPAELLLHYGTQQQKDYYLPRLASGEDIPCFALTGPEAGSDASNLPDTGIVCKSEFKGEQITGILLNWEKRYITLGPIATLLGLAFHLYDPEHLLGNTEDIGITLALIPTDTEGVSIGKRHWPMTMAFQNGPNWGKDVFIPLDWIIGGVEQVGNGWRMLMESLAAGRSISLPALSAGASKLSCQTSSAYARIREQFHLPLSRFEGVKDVMGRMAALTYMIDATRITTAQAVDSGERPAVLSAISKYHLTETMRLIVNDAMDIYGGKGISVGPRNVLANVYQAIPISITVEGANILTRNLIIFGQGSIRAHPYVMKEISCLESEDKQQSLIQFEQLIGQHICYTLGNIARSFFLGVSHGYLSAAPRSVLKNNYQRLNHLSAALTVATDFSLAVLGGSLKRRESLSARLGDVLSQLYLASCTLRHFEHAGNNDDQPLAEWASIHAIYQAQHALIGIINNFPNRFIAVLLRLILFPLGPRYKAADDQLTHHIADLVTQKNTVRERLISGIYQPTDRQEVLGQLEYAFSCCIAAQPIERKLKETDYDSAESALEDGYLNDEEYQLLNEARHARRQVIEVDHFTAELKEDVS